MAAPTSESQIAQCSTCGAITVRDRIAPDELCTACAGALPRSPPRDIGDYSVIEVLSPGKSYGARDECGALVVVAQSTVNADRVLLKTFTTFTLLRFTRDQLRRQVREEESLRGLPDVVTHTRVFDVGSKNLAIAYPYHDAQTLIDWWRDLTNGAPPHRVHEHLARVAVDLLATLEDVHGSRIIHNDIKAENTLVSLTGTGKRPGSFARILLIDLLGASRQGQIPVIPQCTKGFASPELILTVTGKVRGGAQLSPPTAASDLFSVGQTLFELLFGEAPLRATSVPPYPRTEEEVAEWESTVRATILVQEAQLRARLPPCLAACMSELIRFSPDARPQDAGQSRRAFAACLAALGSPCNGMLDTWAPTELQSLHEGLESVLLIASDLGGWIAQQRVGLGKAVPGALATFARELNKWAPSEDHGALVQPVDLDVAPKHFYARLAQWLVHRFPKGRTELLSLDDLSLAVRFCARLSFFGIHLPNATRAGVVVPTELSLATYELLRCLAPLFDFQSESD